jgi:hypothetical protein
MAGGSLMIRGNAYSQGTALASQGYVIRIGNPIVLIGQNGDGSTIESCRLDVAVELNNFVSNTGYNPDTVNFGFNGTTGTNTMQNDYGMLAFRDTGWTTSNVAAGQLTFRGILYGAAQLINNVHVPPAWV